MECTENSGSAAPPLPGFVSGGGGDAVRENTQSMSIHQLMDFLRASFHKSDFEMAANALASREGYLKAASESRFSEELMVREVEKVELEARIDRLVKELEALRSRCSDLERRILQGEGEPGGAQSMEVKDGDNENPRQQDSLSKDTCMDLSGQEKKAHEKITTLLESGKCQDDADFWIQKCECLEAKVQKLENENLSLRRAISMRVDSEVEENYCTLPKSQVECNATDYPLKDCQKPSLTRFIEISDSDSEMTEKGQSLKEIPNAKLLDRKVDLTSEANLIHSVNRQNLIAQKNNVESNVHNLLPIPTPKRRRISRVVTSDSEDENGDDSIPICKLMHQRHGKTVRAEDESDDSLKEITPIKRRLVTLRECYKTREEVKGNSPRYPSTPSTKNSNTRIKSTVFRKLDYSDNEDNDGSKRGQEANDDGSDSEGESLGGFIVNGSDNSASECDLNDSSVYSSEEVNSDADLDGVLGDLHREKDTKNWDYEADMLSAFSRDPELCLKAVCALYRQQTASEKSAKEAILNNKRGFSKFDAPRGSKMAYFLMDGDPHGPLKKSMEELEKYDQGGPEYCHKLANRYSKQLFTIYQNKEDPFFCPSQDHT